MLNKPDEFVVIRILYNTNKTKVSLIQRKYDKKVLVLKQYRKKSLKPIHFYQIQNEIEIHMSLQHENIIKIHNYWVSNNGVYMVLEYACKGDLFDMLYKSNVEIERRFLLEKILCPLVETVKYLHERDIIHFDIKPENIGFTDKDKLVLLDFGLSQTFSQVISNTKHQCFQYTNDYKAPEYSNKYIQNPKAVDVWCIGMLMYELATKMSPKEIKTSSIKLQPLWLNHLFHECTHTNVNQRINIEDLYVKLMDLKQRFSSKAH